MLFAFVSCSPEASSGADSNLLPGEVIPPGESERVVASDEDIAKINAVLDLDRKYTSTVNKLVFDFGDNGKINITLDNVSEGELKAVVNGQIKIDGAVYKADNLVLKYKISSSDPEATIESGSMLKDGTEMSASDVYAFINEKNLSTKDQFKEAKMLLTYKMDLLDSDNNKVGTGIMCTEITVTKDSEYTVIIYDFTANSARVQVKISGKADSKPTIEYVALNGKFFNEESINRM